MASASCTADDLGTIHRAAFGHIQLFDQATHFFHVTRGRIDDQRIGARVGRCLHAWPQSSARSKELRERLLDGRYCRVLQGKHRKLRLGRNRLIELADQLDDRIDRIAPADQQQRVRLD